MSLAGRAAETVRTNRRAAAWIALFAVFLLLGLGAQALLLLVPVCGAVIVRHRTGESSGVLLATSGAALGTAIFWMIVWATMGKLSGLPSSLLAIAFLVSLAVLCATRKRAGEPPPAPIEWPRTLESILFAIMFATVATSIFMTSTPLLDFSETMIFHVPLVASMQRGNVPPINMSEPPHALYYHYGQHTLAAALASFGKLHAHTALFASNAWYGAIATGYAYALARRFGGIASGFGGAVLFAGAGTLNWMTAYRMSANLPDFFHMSTPLGWPFTTGNIAIGSFIWRVHGNSMAWAMCAAFLTVDLLDRAMRTKRFELAIAAGVALAVLAPANETLFAVIAAGTAAVPLKQWIIERKLTLKPLLLAAVTGVLGAGLVLFTGGVLKTFFLSGSATHGASIVFDWSQFGTVASWNFGGFFPPGPDHRVPIFSQRFLQDVGPVPFLLFPAYVWICARSKKSDGALVHVGASAIIALFLGSAMTLTKYPENTFRLVNLCVVLGAVPAGAAFVAAPGQGGPRVLRAITTTVTLLVIAFLVSSWPLIHLGIRANQPTARWYPPRDGGDRVDRDATDALMRRSSYRDGVLSIPYDSWGVLSSGQFSPFGSFVGDRDEYRKKSKEAVAELDLDLCAELSVRYLYVDRRKAKTEQVRRVDQLLRTEKLSVFWQSADGKTAIYEIRR
jgi:hypothetical protein